MAGATRTYDSRLRSDQATRTRSAVVAAAGRRFLANGYAATTIRDIAEAAGVSPETVYKAFGSKLELLRRWIDESVAGPTEPIPVVEQQWVRELTASTDSRRTFTILAAALAEIHDRSADAIAVLTAAAHADPAAAVLWDTVRSQRLADTRSVVSLMSATRALDPALRRDDVVDVAYALTEAHLYRTLVRDRGWSRDRYAAWLAELLWTQFGAKQGTRQRRRSTSHE